MRKNIKQEQTQRHATDASSVTKIRRRLVMAHMGLDRESRARLYATAFLIAPAETMVAGIALIHEVRYRPVLLCTSQRVDTPSPMN